MDNFHPESIATMPIPMIHGHRFAFRFDNKFLASLGVCTTCTRLINGSEGSNFKNKCTCPKAQATRMSKQERNEKIEAQNKLARTPTNFFE
jgi:hypothetical protein